MAVVNVSCGNSMTAVDAAEQSGPKLGLGMAGDALLFDGAEIVAYRVQGTKSASKGSMVETGARYVAVAHALRREVTRREIEGSGSRFRIGDAVFEIPVLELATQPREGDAIFKANERWSVLQADQSTHGTRWRVFARAGA